MTLHGSDRWGAKPRGLPPEFDSWEEAEEANREALRAAHLDAVRSEVQSNADLGVSREEINARVEEKLEDEGWYDE